MQYIVGAFIIGVVVGIFITGKVLFDDVKEIQIQNAYAMAIKDETIERLQWLSRKPLISITGMKA